ncbi:DNA ligase 4 [Nylanderia fulva]|uniref:DNA ligase 4 n=1 Tax=Nylanderia fulva TaxID=613905 RepID=UPI0010FBB6DB|nr:DNA ligase 4 [Nylanderia fulva]XP_029169653.1 DNA ligase 4 [Nylanderia fulva]
MATSLDVKIEFKQLCDTLENAIKVQGIEKKGQILETFIDNCRKIGNKLKTEYPESDVSLYPILRLILPDLERERGPHNLKQVSLARLYARVYGFVKNSDNYKKLENYREPMPGKFMRNDFADRAYQVLDKRLPKTSTGFTIAQMNIFLDDISKKDATMSQKIETFRVLFRHITGFEMKWVTRIVLKDLRLGIGTKRILHIYHQDANEKFLVTNDLREICNQLHDPNTKIKCGIQIFSHFKPMLLERCDIKNIEKLFRDNGLYYVQTKYDGERSQLHMKDGKFKYFTRRGYDITKNSGYGETGSSGFLTSVFTRRLNPNCHSFILDGELMGWHKEKRTFGTKGMNFDVKNLSESSHHQPCFVAFDVILHNDILLVDKPYKDRLKLLDDIFTAEEGSLLVCPFSLISNREELIEAFNECLRNDEEGLVIKKYDMKYKPNVRDGGGCYKIKAEYSDSLIQDIDLIILGGYYGEGKYTGIIKSFMMGVAAPTSNEEENPSRFFAVVSVSSGISDKMLHDLQTKFASHWTKECPENITGPRGKQPDVWIHPKDSIILTIRATEMIRSNEYPIGYSLRFPRVVNIRKDKPWYSPCTSSELLLLVKNKGMIQKLTKREATLSDVDDAPILKLQRTVSRNKLIEHVFPERIVPLTRLLDGKEICVINGTDELAKEQIEETLQQHSARIVQNPMNTTFCVIVGNNRTIRGKEVINSGKYDVVTLDWFKRVTNQSDLSSLGDFLPWELLCSRDITKRRLEANYDEYYDNFIVNADEETLKRSFDKIANSLADQFTVEQRKEMDKELFNGNASPYSLFRDIIGFFENQSCCTKFKFRFMSGTIKDNIDNSVSHIFVEDDKSNNIVENLKVHNLTSVKIVKCKWIEECFRNGRICDITDYLIDY